MRIRYAYEETLKYCRCKHCWKAFFRIIVKGK